ncbi:hypothetical protein LJK88_12000 [Paenibacillus sp. P26]|nr:hypothetical protein LJK88_12000 [Paenibacillus sp. P26]
MTIKFAYMKHLYIAVIAAGSVRLIYFDERLAHSVYQYSGELALLFFAIGLPLNFYVLARVLAQYRKGHAYLSMLIRTIGVSLLISFVPFACLSFLPKVLLGREWVYSGYTGWFVLFFPITFAYLIISKRLYDLDLVLRRTFFMMLIALLPSLVLTLIVALLYPVVTIEALTCSFVVTMVLLTVTFYFLEYVKSNLEKVVFPRKYMLQAALKNIAGRLRSVTSFQELKEMILVDIVRTLQVYGAAIVFRYPSGTESIAYGEIREEEFERLVLDNRREHPDYHFFDITRHEEYDCYLIMGKKKTNTYLGLEETQWLKLIISYLAVSLENIYLIRKLTLRSHTLASQIPGRTKPTRWSGSGSPCLSCRRGSGTGLLPICTIRRFRMCCSSKAAFNRRCRLLSPATRGISGCSARSVIWS